MELYCQRDVFLTCMFLILPILPDSYKDIHLTSNIHRYQCSLNSWFCDSEPPMNTTKMVLHKTKRISQNMHLKFIKKNCYFWLSVFCIYKKMYMQKNWSNNICVFHINVKNLYAEYERVVKDIKILVEPKKSIPVKMYFNYSQLSILSYWEANQYMFRAKSNGRNEQNLSMFVLISPICFWQGEVFVIVYINKNVNIVIFPTEFTQISLGPWCLDKALVFFFIPPLKHN